MITVEFSPILRPYKKDGRVFSTAYSVSLMARRHRVVQIATAGAPHARARTLRTQQCGRRTRSRKMCCYCAAAENYKFTHLSSTSLFVPLSVTFFAVVPVRLLGKWRPCVSTEYSDSIPTSNISASKLVACNVKSSTVNLFKS